LGKEDAAVCNAFAFSSVRGYFWLSVKPLKIPIVIWRGMEYTSDSIAGKTVQVDS
jgi:hypothetical protein